MKGIPNNIIKHPASNHFKGSVKALYLYLFDGKEITFDLNTVAIRFIMEKTGEISHKNKFMRCVKATAPLPES